MTVKEQLFTMITTLNNNRPVSIKNDTTMITIKKRKKNDMVDVWLFYKIKDNFKELYHTVTSTKCQLCDIEDIIEDMKLEIPNKPQTKSETKSEEKVEVKQTKHWYDGLNAVERAECLDKYYMMILIMIDDLLQSGESTEDKDLIDLFGYYGLEEKDLKLLGVIG